MRSQLSLFIVCQKAVESLLCFSGKILLRMEPPCIGSWTMSNDLTVTTSQGVFDVKAKPILDIGSRLRMFIMPPEAYVSEDGKHVDYRRTKSFKGGRRRAGEEKLLSLNLYNCGHPCNMGCWGPSSWAKLNERGDLSLTQRPLIHVALVCVLDLALLFDSNSPWILKKLIGSSSYFSSKNEVLSYYDFETRLLAASKFLNVLKASSNYPLEPAVSELYWIACQISADGDVPA
ncbi:unnamed protein product [Prunus armeniaca]|uniref:Uncharacterized protein n=1 Tax=Prunus armeniaca TaxID=36596 RepID=A0A6J5WAY9_PRUAR|nr:unnamed protein product [Prunus armeniaca]